MNADVAMPALVGLTDLAAMNAGDQSGHRYETGPEGLQILGQGHEAARVRSCRHPAVPGGRPGQCETVTLHRLGADGAYAVAATMPLAWLPRTEPAEHLGD